MAAIVVRYTAKHDRADENQRLVEAVFAELAERKPAGLRYASLRLADGAGFVHIATIETDDGSNPLGEIEAFAEFTRDIAARCEESPVAAEASLIGAYRLFADA